jgi:FAD/FMN-containing dehydrogenase
MRFFSPGRTAPSFLIAVGGAVIGILGYLAWETLRVTPHQKSEEIVRRFARSVAAEVGQCRRAIRRMSRRAAGPAASAEDVDGLAADAIARIEAEAEAARERIESLEGIPLRTQDNRLERIERRLGEGKAAIGRAASDAKALLRPEGDAADARRGTVRERPLLASFPVPVVCYAFRLRAPASATQRSQGSVSGGRRCRNV